VFEKMGNNNKDCVARRYGEQKAGALSLTLVCSPHANYPFNSYLVLFMVALCNRANHYIFAL